jgi:DNA polymerase III epsilon subunit-like protein
LTNASSDDTIRKKEGKMSDVFLVDVEADGPCPGLFSMVQLGIVKFGEGKTPEFLAYMRPIGQKYDPSALRAIGLTYEETLEYPPPEAKMLDMRRWLEQHSTGRPVFVSDNPAFDWQFVNYYCHLFLGSNPFGFSARRIGDFAAGLNRDFRDANSWKRLRRTKHTHNPVDDARGNCEALVQLIAQSRSGRKS